MPADPPGVRARIVVEVEIDPQEWARQYGLPDASPRAVRDDAEVRLTGRILHALRDLSVQAAPLGKVPFFQRLAVEIAEVAGPVLPDWTTGRLLVSICLDGQRVTADGAL